MVSGRIAFTLYHPTRCCYWYASCISFLCVILLDPGSNLSYVTSLVAVNFEISAEEIFEPFLVSTPVGEFVVAK